MGNGSPRRALRTVATLALAFATVLRAFGKGGAKGEAEAGGRNYDLRTTLEVGAPSLAPAQAGAVARLRASIPTLLASADAVTGGTRSLSNATGFLTGARSGDAEQIAIEETLADDRGWETGSEVDVRFPDGTTSTFTVGAIYEPSGSVQQMVMPRDSFVPHQVQTVDNLVVIGLADGVGLEEGRSAVEDATVAFAPPDVQTTDEYVADATEQVIQALLREVSSDVLVVSLKGADEKVKDKIFRNMSKRASELLRDDLEAKGPVRVSDVETAQKEILTIARRMAEAGEIVLGGKGAEEMI